jgi:mannose-6-phosphate isomerase-like protein (cupin superfamily)
VIGKTLAELLEARAEADVRYLEFIRVASMSVGLYVLPADAIDGQSPHDEDEVYVVLAGLSQFTSGNESRHVTEGDVIFVPAREPHHFHHITEELRLAVVFSPPES